MMREVKWQLAMVADNCLLSNWDAFLNSPSTSQRTAEKMARPDTKIGMLVQGPWIRKNVRTPSTYFVSFDKNTVFEVLRAKTGVGGSLKLAHYRVLDSQLIAPFMTRALAKTASAMSDDLQI
jgi:hypothetical protein